MALPSSQFWRPADSYQRAKSIKDKTTQAYHWEEELTSSTNLLQHGGRNGHTSSPDTETDKHVHRQQIQTFLYILFQLVSLSLGNITGFFIPRKPRGSQSTETWGSGLTPDALLLAPRATERFLKPVKPAGCAQGSKIQQIPGQLSGDSYFVNGHTEPQTLLIFENGTYRLTKLISNHGCSSEEYSWM